MTKFICESIRPVNNEENDRACWLGDTSGEFSTKSAFQLIRDRIEGFDWARYIWIKGLPSKISFFLWRLRRCIPTDDNVKRLRV